MISLKEHNPELLSEWDYKKNSDIGKTPDNTSYGSANKVWWICPKGHSYLMGPNSKTCAGKTKQSCPICSGKKVLKGFNDLATIRPELLFEWDFNKNDKLGIFPDNVTYGSSVNVWWKCEKGHEFLASISRRTTTQKSGCPFCSNKKLLKSYNDLKSRYPNIAMEFNVYKNKGLPSDYLSSSSHKVWWICSKCGYEWKTSIVDRTSNKQTGCPECSNHKYRQTQLKKIIIRRGTLYDNYPLLMKEWDYSKNDKDPKNIVSGSEYKAWWKCLKCNYEWQAIVASRTKNGTGCPVCSSRVVVEGINDFKTLFPEYAKEWDYDKNDKLHIYPNEVISFSDKKVWWICPTCKQSYQTAIKNRSRGTACPHCANELRTSFPEQAIYYYLKKTFNDTQNRWNDLGHEIDIFVPSLNLGIEYDGVYFHNTEASLNREEEKFLELMNKGITLIRIREKNLNNQSYANYTISLSKKNNDKEIEDMIIDIFGYIEINYNISFNIDINLKRDRQFIYSQYIVIKKNDSIAKKYPELLKEWDYDKNKVSPESIVPGSEKKMWWLCSKGHSYEQQVYNHIKGAGCPYCSGLKVIQGENDLESLFPDLAKEWDYEKNDILPSQIKYGSSKKVWWKCPKGHSYEAAISHRTGKQNEKCPICCNKKILKGYNDLESLRPDLMKEWDYEKNNINPENVSCGSQKKVWWKCPKGHSYESVIHSRANSNTGCPVCNGKIVIEGINDFKSQQNDLMKEWNYEKNEKLGIFPNKIHYHAWKNVWWKCSKCGQEWQAMPGKRIKGTDCPFCSSKISINSRIKHSIAKFGSFLDNYPDLAKEWDYEENEFEPNHFACGSHESVWWKCPNCNHIYQKAIRDKVKHPKCPKCKYIKKWHI